jgi:ketosteroid isomerase-like protein
MRRIFLVVLSIISSSAFSQNFQKEINDQVWKPFISTFNNLDASGFLTVHSKDVIRSSRDSKILLNWTAYLKQQQEGDKRSKENGVRRTLELRFTERIANANQAIDVGIYKTTVTDKVGKIQSFYGRFHVVLRKENAVWRILVDTDSSENQSIDEKDFSSASAME